jgi:hypothetical protein
VEIGIFNSPRLNNFPLTLNIFISTSILGIQDFILVRL